MRLRNLVCLWGGLVCFGSSSRQASEADRSPKQCVDDVTKKDARPRGGTYNNRGMRTDIISACKPDGDQTRMKRGMTDRGDQFFNINFKTEASTSTNASHPTNMCSISSGTGCPYFVSTIEWASQTGLPGALLIAPAHAISVDDDDDDEGEDGGDYSGDNQGSSSSTPPFLPVEHAATKPWRSDGLDEKNGSIGGRQSVIIARYDKPSYPGLELSTVPQPVCLVVYILVVLTAAYRGNPRRGLKRHRRMQRRARSSLYAKRRLAARCDTCREAPGDKFLDLTYSVLGIGIDEIRRRLPGVGLSIEDSGREGRNQEGNASLFSSDTSDTPTKETAPCGTCKDVVKKSDLQPIAAIPSPPLASQGAEERPGTSAKVTMHPDKNLEGAVAPITDTFPPSPSVRASPRPGEEVSLPRATSVLPSTIDAALDCPSFVEEKSDVKTAAPPAAPPVSKGESPGKGKPIATCTAKLEEAKTPEAACKVNTNATEIPSVRIPSKPSRAAQVSGATSSAPAAIDVVLERASSAAKAPSLKPAAAAAAARASTAGDDNPASSVESLATCAEIKREQKKPEPSSRAAATSTPTVPSARRIQAKPALATPSSGAASSVTSAINGVRNDPARTSKPPSPKPSSILAAKSVTTSTIARQVVPLSTCSNVMQKTQKMAAASRSPATGVSPIPPSSAKTAARPPQAVRLPGATSPAPSAVDVVLGTTSCATTVRNCQPPISIAATAFTTAKKAASELESVDMHSRVIKQQQRLEADIRAATAAASILPPTAARGPKKPIAGDGDDVHRRDARDVPLSGAFSQPPEKDNVVLGSDPGAARAGPTIPPPELEAFSKLFSNRKPAILDIMGWFNGYSIQIDPDGNCYGTSWMITVLIWAAQRPGRLDCLITTLEHANHPTANAFGGLDETCKGYVDDLVVYIKSLRAKWTGHDDFDTTRGAYLAVEAVRMFWGDKCPGYVGTEGEGEDPAWLKLKWGVAIASRSLDAWAAARNGFDVDMEKLCKLGESVQLEFGMLQGLEGNTPAADVLRPGGSVGLVAGLVVETFSQKFGRRQEDYTTFLAGATNTPSDRTITGLAVHQAGLPHFDILVTDRADVLFFHSLVATFGLPEPVDLDYKALQALEKRVTSQVVASTEELEGFVPDDELEEQRQAMKAYEERQARDRQSK